MSYCRWSTDDHRCDLYCYEDASGGWTTHVAARRRVGLEQRPHEDWHLLTTGSDDDAAEFWQQHAALGAWIDAAGSEPIGGRHDGETFNDPTLEDFLDTLLMLRAAGYCFPDYVLDEVREELKVIPS